MNHSAPLPRRLNIYGHRGARGLFPENTIEGFRAALALGVTAFELDVGLTADGVAVLTHDLALNPAVTRDAQGRWLPGAGPLIWSMPFAGLMEYDVGRLCPGTAYDALFPAQQPVDGARIPALSAALALAGIERFVIELKTDPRFPADTASPEAMADVVLRAIDAAGVAERSILESFDWRGPRHIRRKRPGIAMAWLTRAETIRDAHQWWGGPHPSDFGGSVPRAVAAEGGGIWAPAFTDLTQELVAEAHDLGLSVVPWTVNEPADMRRVIGWGVDGLITDRPDLGMTIRAGDAVMG